MTAPATSRLAARGVSLGYGDLPVIDDLTVAIPDGSFTVIIGPNGCGKSTLLKAFARTIPARAGEILLDGRPIGSYRSKAVARTIAMLPQSPIAPESITVRELVGRGRYPHQSLLKQWSHGDEVAVESALAATQTLEFADRPVSALSGGQRQRVWIALVLAQDTDLVLLDEPTTFLDLSHQFDVLDVCASLHEEGKTLVVVLHDLSQAARYASHLVVMKDGEIFREGAPGDVVTEELVREVYGLECRVIPDPESGTPLVIPRPRASRSTR